MATDPREHPHSVDVRQLHEIDRICDRFEQAWRKVAQDGGDSPSIQQQLEAVEASLRPSLLKQLVLLDMEYRGQVASQPSLDFYLKVHPQYASILNELRVQANTTDDEKALLQTKSHDPDAIDDSDVRLGTSGAERIGRFRILRDLGKGSFGTVRLAWDEELQREVAIKVAHRALDPRSGEDHELNEARMAASLDHPAIVPVYECGRRPDGSLFVVTKFIDGTDLKTRIAEFDFSTEQALQLVSRIAEAAHSAHEKGLVHRDIKPANILIDGNHQPYLADFGLALRSELTGTGSEFVGTPAYMSPEQARGEGHLVDRRSDIFSLAAVLYQLIYKRLPFGGQNRAELLDAISNATPPDFAADVDVSSALQRVLRKALSRRAADRQPTAKVLADELRSCLDHDAVQESAQDSTVIVPRGLRSYTARDAKFFLQLVPGPRESNGLPEAVAYWKTRLESKDEGTAFRVGVLYGPSGTGKSSLMRAGVVPALDAAIVPVFVTATPDNTEADCLKAVRRAFPAITHESALPKALRELRDRRLQRDQKLVLIIDQFEQWLHTNRDTENEALINAMRQCDGENVQIVLLVRDDYWYQLNRCLVAADVETSSNNSRAAESFDAQHASDVLAALGRAYGRLDDQSGEHSAFVSAAISEMTTADALTPVQLALFADVMKSRPWTVSELKRVGGVEGATSILLDQILNGEQAHPILNRHSTETGLLLRALLPPSGTNIKAQPQTVEQLSKATGLSAESVQPLVDVLDSEFRIVARITDEDSDQPKFQLSHDYLVPIVRQWSQRTHGETFAGRMELLLEDRTKAWSADRKRRNMPGPLEWLGIALSTNRSRRTAAAQQMMSAAGRWYLSIAALTTLILSAASYVGTSRFDRYRCDKLVEQLASAEIDQIEPLIAKTLATGDSGTDAIRRYQVGHPEMANHWPLVLTMAAAQQAPINDLPDVCVSSDPSRTGIIGRLLQRMQKDSDPSEFEQLTDEIGEKLDALREQPAKQLSAAAALAVLCPKSEAWSQRSELVVDAMFDVDETQLPEWLDLLSPIRESIEPIVLEHSQLADVPCIDQPKPTEESLTILRRCATIAARLYPDLPEVLVATIESATPAEFRRLMPLLQQMDSKSVRQVVSSRLAEIEPQQNPVSTELDEAALGQETEHLLQSCSGIATTDFVVALELKLGEAKQLNSILSQSGFAIKRLRSYNDNSGRFCAFWTKQNCASQQIWAGTRDEITARDKALGASWTPRDVSCYYDNNTGTVTYCAFWSKASRIDDERILFYDWAIPLHYSEPGQAQPRCLHTLHAKIDDALVFSAIEGNAPFEGRFDGWYAATGLPFGSLEQVVDSVNFVRDLSLTRPLGYDGSRLAARARLNSISPALPRDVALYWQANQFYHLGAFDKAYDTLIDEVASGKSPPYWIVDLLVRAAARLEKSNVEELLSLGLNCCPELDDRLRIESIVRELSGKDGLSLLDAPVESESLDDSIFANRVLAASEIADHWREKDPVRYRRSVEGIKNHLRQTINSNFHEWAWNRTPSLAYELENKPDLRHGLPDIRLHAIKHNAVEHEQRLVSGTRTEALTAINQLATSGYSPNAIASPASDGKFAVLLYRPKVRYLSQIELTRRKLRLNAVLCALAEASGDTTSPFLNPHLARNANRYGLAEALFWQHLTNDGSDKQYLALVALSTYPDDVSFEQAELLARIYESSKDAGIHSAARLVMDRRGCEPQRRKIDDRSSNVAGKHWSTYEGITFSHITEPTAFKMGSPATELGRKTQYEILHRCRIPYAFAISTTEITSEQMLHTGLPRFRGASSTPTLASWFDAAKFCRWLDEKMGVPEDQMCYPPIDEIHAGMTIPFDFWKRSGHRLPTEAEWEFIARAGSEEPRFFGKDPTDIHDFAVVDRKGPRPVASKLPNRFGIFDCYGNAWEWCQDKHDVYNHFLGSRHRVATNGGGLVSAAATRVLRGGSHDTEMNGLRSAARSARVPKSAHGFRIARSLSNKHID